MADSWGGAIAGVRSAHDASVLLHKGGLSEMVTGTDQLRVLIEHTSDIVTVVAGDGSITFQSPSCRRVLGYEPEELLGSSSFDLIHPDDVMWVSKLFGELVLVDGVTQPVRLRCRHKSGMWVWLEAIGNNLLNQPDIAGMVISSRDISAQVRAEQSLQQINRARQEEAEVMGAMARIGQEMISCLDTPSLVDRLCRVTAEALGCDYCETRFWDPKRDALVWVAAYGATPEERETARSVAIPRRMVPNQAREIWHGHIDDVESSEIRQLGHQYAVGRSVLIPLLRGNELIGTQCAVFRNREGRFSPAQLQIARAIGQLGAMALENARLVEELQRASRLKSEFVATMSHELRTPLNVIIGYTDLLLEESFGSLSSEQRQVCRRVERSAGELLELINATLDLGRLESGRLPLDLQVVSLGEIVAAVEAETRELCKPQTRVHWRMHENLPLLRSDPLKIKVILKNLITNAIKFTPAGEIEVSAGPHEDGVEIAVRDTGIGISPETQGIIFEAFRQVDGSMSRRFGGVGLGLYIVRRLVEALGGTVSVSSELGKGSTFYVSLPTNQPVER